jgi:2-polyprenyl-3-methyl-5-hydroxy-6-metoxy-1,4-benzoquinol methylase
VELWCLLQRVEGPQNASHNRDPMMKNPYNFSEEQIRRISEVSHLRKSQYYDIDVYGALDYMERRYVRPALSHLTCASPIVADCACGYGWLSFAFLLNGAAKAYLIDIDQGTLNAAREVAEIIGVESRCEFVISPLQEIKIPPFGVDVFASIETLEHVGKKNVKACLKVMASTTSQVVMFTTPNKLFPVIAHDSQVPFAHWLPRNARPAYARLFGRRDENYGNDFVWPWDLGPLQREFKPVSKYQMFDSLAEFDAFYPHYLPYLTEPFRYRQKPPFALRALTATLGKSLGRRAYWLAPNLASVWTRR